LQLSSFIVDLAGHVLRRPEQYFSPGHNGPYHDRETPIRNLGHWLITFARCHAWTGEERFREKVTELGDCLCSDQFRPYGHSFHHRNEPSKDGCNGLIGQAWTFEALAAADSCCQDTSYGETAARVFFRHPFSQQHGLWHVVDIDGTELAMDMAFNHQLWFAACASMIRVKREIHPLIEGRVRLFLNKIWENLRILEDGLVFHTIEWLWERRFDQSLASQRGLRRRLSAFFKSFGSRGTSENSYREGFREEAIQKITYKSIGYHAFNMYAFALLKQQLPEHPFWESSKFRTAVDYMLRKEYWKALDDNKYGYPYNPPGFEVPFALHVLKDMNPKVFRRLTEQVVNDQLKRCYDAGKRVMARNTEDVLTHSARLYEITRLPKDILKAIQVVH